MFLRLFIACLGAITITGFILLSMSEVTSVFTRNRPDRVFLITDILPAPERGRPARPPDAELPHERPVLELDTGDTTIRVEGPSRPGDQLRADPALERPSLETDD